MATVLIKRGTRAQLNAAAAASGLKQGELYLITDESTLAVGVSVSAYIALGTLATQNANAVAITGGTISGLTSIGSRAVTVDQGALTLTPVAAPGAPTLSATVAGSKPAGTWNVKCTWVTATGETALGTVSSNITVDGSKAITTTQPASPPALATGWKVYSSKQGPTATWWVTSGTIPIATTTYDDNTADASLTVDATLRDGTAGVRLYSGATSAGVLGAQNLMLGSSAGVSITTGTFNVFLGPAAGTNATTAIQTVAVGHSAALSNATSPGLVAVGYQAGRDITSGNSVFVGMQSGYRSGAAPSVANAVTTGSGVTFVGHRTGFGSSTQRTNATAIGYEAWVDASNRVVLGNGSVVDVWAGSTAQATYVASAYQTLATARTLANGLNSNITGAGFLRVTGPTGAFSVGGFTLGADGRELKVYNTTAQAMTIVNEDASSTAANRITTLTGADVVLRTGTSFATFTYDSTASRWILTSYN